MSKSIIISSNSQSFVTEKIQQIKTSLKISDKNTTDFISITIPEDKMSIGIEQMQDLIIWSKTKAYSADGKLACILHAESLTEQAQNAILKMLEEPTSSNNYVLITANFSELLPTILSRCELIYDNASRQTTLDIQDFLEADQLDRFKYLERFQKIENSAEKFLAEEEFLITLIKHVHAQFLQEIEQGSSSDEISKSLSNIEIISTCHKMLVAKVPAKSVLDYLVVNINID